ARAGDRTRPRLRPRRLRRGARHRRDALAGLVAREREDPPLRRGVAHAPGCQVVAGRGRTTAEVRRPAPDSVRRISVAVLTCVLLWIGAAPSRAADEPIVRAPSFAGRVDAAIASGVAWLRSEQ